MTPITFLFFLNQASKEQTINLFQVGNQGQSARLICHLSVWFWEKPELIGDEPPDSIGIIQKKILPLRRKSEDLPQGYPRETSEPSPKLASAYCLPYMASKASAGTKDPLVWKQKQCGSPVLRTGQPFEEPLYRHKMFSVAPIK